MITAGLNMIFDLNFIGLTISLSVIILFYTVVCIYAHSKFQTYITLMLTWLLGAAITCIFVGGAIFVTADIITGKYFLKKTLSIQRLQKFKSVSLFMKQRSLPTQNL